MGDSQEEAQSCMAKPSPRLADLLSEELPAPGGNQLEQHKLKNKWERGC